MTTCASADATMSPAEPLSDAVAIATTLCATALWHDDRCLWLTDEAEPAGDGVRVVHTDCGVSLYSGTAGIGWFLAHLAARTDRADAAATARAALMHALDTARRHRAAPTLHTGSAGVGWACIDAGVALGEWELVTGGLDLLAGAVEDPAVAELPAELIAGRAGLVLAGLAGARRAAEHGYAAEAARVTAGSVAVGKGLLNVATRTPTGWTWSDEAADVALCGLGHGMSGPVLACGELAVTTGDGHFATAAREGARAERAWLNSGTDGGWPDLRESSRDAVEAGHLPTSPLMWCHGTLGVGLCRLRTWRATQDPGLLADATAALHLGAAGAAALPTADFSLCHGAAGLVELFVVAAAELDAPEWLTPAADLAAAGHAGRGWGTGLPGGTEVPGLMLGLAGTGIALLRLADALAGRTGGPSSPLLLTSAPTRRSLIR